MPIQNGGFWQIWSLIGSTPKVYLVIRIRDQVVWQVARYRSNNINILWFCKIQKTYQKTYVGPSYIRLGVFKAKTVQYHAWAILGLLSIWKYRLTSKGIPIIKIRRSHDSLIFITEIPYLERSSLYWDGPWLLEPWGCRQYNIYHVRYTVFHPSCYFNKDESEILLAPPAILLCWLESNWRVKCVVYHWYYEYCDIDGLVQEIHYSNGLAMELLLSCIGLSIWYISYFFTSIKSHSKKNAGINLSND